MPRLRWILDEKALKMVPAAEFYAKQAAERDRCRQGSPMVIGEIPPSQAFRSTVHGSLITSRAELRAHNARNGVSDVGNDAAFRNPTRKDTPRESAKPMLRALMNGDMPVATPRQVEEAT